MKFDERDEIEAKLVGIDLSMPIPGEVEAIFDRVMNICEYCTKGCPLLEESAALAALRVATGRIVENDYICEDLKSFVLANKLEPKK